MQDFLGSDRKDSRGKHRYDAARYGLTDDGVRERFSEYLDHFGIS